MCVCVCVCVCICVYMCVCVCIHSHGFTRFLVMWCACPFFFRFGTGGPRNSIASYQIESDDFQRVYTYIYVCVCV